MSEGSHEPQLSAVLGEFARTLLTDFPIQAILDHLVQRIVTVLPITAAGVTLISPGSNPRYVAASDDAALRFEMLQTELGEGPCLAAYQTGEAVAVADLRCEPRFPSFGPRAVEAGLVAVFTFPLCHGDERLGALDLYRDTPGPLDAATMTAAQTLANVAAAYLLNAQGRADLRDALDQSLELALHDALTGLPNRILLLDRLERALARRHRRPSSTAVLFIDLDRFKSLNDALGHAGGDQLLIEVAGRLRASVREEDTVARLGGDEFVVVCEDPDDELHVTALAARISEACALPFDIDGQQVQTTLSIGIAFASAAGEESAEQLLRDADAAMYRAKDEGRDRYEIFDSVMHSRAQALVDLEQSLRHALDGDELVVFYQPIVNLSTNDVVGVEALVRWDHPECGRLLPGEFIAVAETTGLIVPIGAYVLEEACRQVAAWRHRRPVPLVLSLSVNLSARQLLAPGLVQVVRGALAASGLPPTCLCLELTESVLLDDAEASIAAIDELRTIGVRVAIDDFGTGYSSLTYVSRFRVDTLKIDRSFISGLVHDRHNRVIVSTIVDLARGFGLRTIGEGVETAAQLTLLRALRCEAAQGFWWSPALPADELERWMDGASVVAAPGEIAGGPQTAGVLIVEDDTSLREMLRLLFDGEPGYRVVGIADDGREAVSLAARCQPDLVLLDLAMPGMGGMEALPLILGVAPEAKIVVLTGLLTPTSEDNARSHGAAHVVEKGMDVTALIDQVDRVLAAPSR